MTNLVKSWGPVAIWMGLIFYLSAVPHLEITTEPVGNFLTRKAAHLAEYAILTLLLFRAQGYTRILRAIVLSAAYGVTDETHQYFVPSRTPMLFDLITDLFGAVLGGAIWKYSPTLRRKLPS